MLEAGLKTGNPDDVRLALSQGGDVNTSTRGVTPLVFALIDDNPDLISFILGQPDLDVNLLDRTGYDALSYAIKLGKPSIVNLLVSHGAHVTPQAQGNIMAPKSRLAFLAGLGKKTEEHLAISELLIDRGAS